MAASYSLQDFVGNGVLNEILDELEADGWDDVPTLKMMNAADMEAADLNPAQRDALELRSYLHDRGLMQYADTLESSHKRLPQLLGTNPSELSSKYGMKRGHVARFVDRSLACGVQLPPDLSLPARKRTWAPKDGGSEYSSYSMQSSGTSPPRSVRSNVSNVHPNVHKSRVSQDQRSVDSRSTGVTNGFGVHEPAKKMPDETATPIKGIMAQNSASPRFCGLMKPNNEAHDVTPLSILEKIYVQRLTPEYKNGVDPWSSGELRLPPPIKASELWSSQPTLLLCVRRPGCVMCRAEAHQLYARKPIFDAMGIQLVAVLNEYIDAEVKAFWPRYWGGQVVVDRNRDFFKAMGGGKLLKDDLLTGFVFNSQAWRNWKRARAFKFEYNLAGEGLIKGGVYILAPGKSGVAYQYIEKTFGDWAPLGEVMEVCTSLQSTLPVKKNAKPKSDLLSDRFSSTSDEDDLREADAISFVY